MKASLSLVALCSFMIGSAYAQISHKTNVNSSKQQDNKPAFKISERRVLKALPKEEEEVSSFSMEELRVGAQRILDKAQVQYYKSQCRYAFMSDRDVIENRCESKRISRPR
ncbi:hypothetical protein V6W73_05545 [Mannheimia sp. HC-2023]